MTWEALELEWKDWKGRARIGWGRVVRDERMRVRGKREELEAASMKRARAARSPRSRCARRAGVE